MLLLLILPYEVEQVRFAWTRGKERAEAEVARQLLDEGRGPTIGQYRTVVKAVQRRSWASRRRGPWAGRRTMNISSFLFGPGGFASRTKVPA